MGHEASCEQVSIAQSIRLGSVFVIWHPVRMEYITIVSIMITMTVWDFVIGVLFGIVVSCESLFNVCDNVGAHRFVPCLRLLLCRPEFPAPEHPNVLHGRRRNLHRPPTSSSPCIHSRSV